MAQSAACSSTPDPSLTPTLDTPHQPRAFSFPKRPFGKQKVVYRSFQASWFASWTWLHYDEVNDFVLCHLCTKAVREKKMVPRTADFAFLSRGFMNWKDATASFRAHEKSQCHKEAVEKVLTLPATTRDVGEMLSSTLAEEKAANRHCLLMVMSSLKFLARQGCALRGHDDDKNSNFYQLLMLRCENDSKCQDWMRKRTERYINHEAQNELLKLMASTILRKIASDLQATEFFAIMVDECTDVTNHEQVVIVLRWVDDELDVHEEFIGLYEVPTIEASSLHFVIKDALLRMNLSLARARGQCYDGSSNMCGVRSGVAKRIQDEEPKALFTHCYGHSLSLAASDTIQGCKTMKSALETTHEITKLIKYSPRRENLFREIRGEIAPGTPGVRVLCPTRWTVRADSMQSIIANYSVLQPLWEKAADIVHNTETIARIRGIAAQMLSFEFFFGLVLGEILLRHTDNLSKALQGNYSAAEGQRIVEMTKKTLQSIRSEERFELFWIKVTTMASDMDVDEPTLSRKRKRPQRFEQGDAPAEYPSTPKDRYRQVYYEALDLLVQAIDNRFDQEGYRTYRCLETLLLKAVKKDDFSEELKAVLEVYSSDMNASDLKLQVEILSTSVTDDVTNIVDVKKYLQSLSPSEKALLSEVMLVMKLVLVMPATNASSERSFSAMRRVKSYLRSTMSQERLNNLMILHVHKELTDNLALSDIGNEFVSKSERRLHIFGKF